MLRVYGTDSIRLNGVLREFHEPVSVNVVVERQLLVLQYGPLGKNPHSHLVANGPFCDIAIGVATVVCESPDPAFFSRVDELHVAPLFSAH